MRFLRKVCAFALALGTLLLSSCDLLPLEETEVPTTPPTQATVPETTNPTPSENLPKPTLNVKFVDFNYYEMGKGGWLAGANMREEETGQPSGYTGKSTKTTSILVNSRAGNVGGETGFIVDIKSVSSAWDGWDEDDYISIWLKVEWTVMAGQVNSFRLHFLNHSYTGSASEGFTNAYQNNFENIMDGVDAWTELKITKADVMNVLKNGSGGNADIKDEDVKKSGLADYLGVYFHGMQPTLLSVYSVEFVEVQ